MFLFKKKRTCIGTEGQPTEGLLQHWGFKDDAYTCIQDDIRYIKTFTWYGLKMMCRTNWQACILWVSYQVQ